MDKNEVADKYLNRRIVILEGNINEDVYNKVRLSLLGLDADSNKEIILYVNSVGGIGNAGLLLNDTIDMLRSPVKAVVMLAASAALTVVQSCRMRCIVKSGKILIHDSAWSGKDIIYDDQYAARMEVMREQFEQLTERKTKILSRRTGLSNEKLQEMMQEGRQIERWIYARKAKRLNFVDKILGSKFKLLKN